MKQYINRVTAMLLLAAMVLGLVAGVPIVETSAAVTDINGNEVVNIFEDYNGTFEEFSIPNWTYSYGVHQSCEQAYKGGEYSLRLCDSSATESAWALSGKANITAGEVYIISAQVYGEAIGQVTAYFYDAAGAEMTEQTIYLATEQGASEWQELYKEFVAPDGAKKVAFRLSTTEEGTADVFFDAVTLAIKPVERVTPSLQNPGFEESWTSGVPTGWRNGDYTGTQYQVVAEGDNHILKVTKASGQGMQLYTKKFAVLPSETYTFSIDVKASPRECLQVYIYFYNERGAKVNSPMRETWVSVPTQYLNGEWTRIYANALAPVNAVSADVLIIDPHSGNNDEQKVAYFDNATMEFSEGSTSYGFENAYIDDYGFATGFSNGWTRAWSINEDSQYVYSGSGSLCVNSPGHIIKTFPMKAAPGEEFEGSAYVKRQEGMDDEHGIQIGLYFYDARGQQLDAKFGNFVATNEWTKISFKAVAPDGAVAVSALIPYFYRGSGNFYFDDVALVQTTEYNFLPNLLTNGAFEQKSTTNNIMYPEWYAASKTEGDIFSVKYYGEERGYTAHVKTDKIGYAQMWTDPITVTPGETYSFSMEAIGTGRIQPNIFFYASPDDDRYDYLVKENGIAEARFTTTPLYSDTWVKSVVTSVVVPENATCARIWICPLMDVATNTIDMSFDNAVFFKGVAAREVPGEVGVIPNASFEEVTSNGLPIKWNSYNDKVHSIVDANVDPDNVFDGRYALKLTVPPDKADTHGVDSDPFPVEEGVTYQFSLYMKEDEIATSDGWQFCLRYYDNFDSQLATFFGTSANIGDWNYYSVSGPAPTGAVYATIILVSGAAKGVCYIDKLQLEVQGGNANAIVPFDGDWEFIKKDHPRLYYGTSELDRMKAFTNSHADSAYTYRGEDVYKALLAEADKYLSQTEVSHGYVGGVYKTFPLYPVLEDPTCREDFLTPPPGFADDFRYPYMTAFTGGLVNRAETLTLAYSLSGNKAYGERAVQMMLDICDWKYWYGENEQLDSPDEWSNQSTGYLVDVVSMTYDACYDLLTPAQREKVCNTLIEKGLEAFYHDCMPRMMRRRDMDHATGLIIASCAIMNENNFNQLKKYLDMGMTYIYWRLNDFQYSGINEGHMYDSLAVDDIIWTLTMLERTTGYAGPWDHPYMDTLQDVVLGFFDNVNGTLPSYSDSDFKAYYPISMAIFGQKGNELATYYLSMSNALETNFQKLVFFTKETLDSLERPKDYEGNVGYVESFGFGSLRTGWGVLDPLLTIVANNSQQEHNHYEQNHILLSFNGKWTLTDTGYQDLSGSALQRYQTKYANTTILVDGKPQARKGQGTLNKVFDTALYGYFIGSAPDAYGMENKKNVLNRFDRHAIMINHDNFPYYVIIDDLESNKDREFGWNFFTNGWDRLEVDGVNVLDGESATGNRVTIARSGNTLHSIFVGNEKLNVGEFMYEGNGPTLLVESNPAKEYQFMNVIAMQKGSGGQTSVLFDSLMEKRNTTICEYEGKNGVAWSTRKTDDTKNSTLSVSIGGPLVMFRAGEVGDWIKFPFDVEKDGEYQVTIDMGRSTGYDGRWNVYVDDELITTYFPNGPLGVVAIDAGKREMTAGRHYVKMELEYTPDTPLVGTIASIGAITLDDGSAIGEGDVKVAETYDDENVLGAKITYGLYLSDVVMFNRGNGVSTAGKLSTDGQQASVMGLYNDVMNEGYAVTKGTTMKYGEKVLLNATGPVSLAVDYTLAHLPIKNTDDEKELVLPEDLDVDEPLIKVSASAEAEQTVTFFVGKDAPYVVSLNGETVETIYADNMITMTIPAGQHEITIVGDHQCVFDQYLTHIRNIKAKADCENPTIFYVSCVCGRNGTETFTSGEAKGHTLVEVKAVEPTEFEDGNIAHWKCKKCNKLFSDAKGTRELKASDVILLNLSAEMARKRMITGIAIGGGVVVLLAAVFVILWKLGVFKKKSKEETLTEDQTATDSE